ncbi:MAG: glycosyltransferase family 4 protein [Candidatus Heimdallarchaeota archaeon]|nr:glycosyltransferase family 4 protein [Candidatus Heimdallarchaeota archaeon]MDH5646005.1 glycosyltransferase family 4 protein [Candidatus Heimdallarchaeota archaeon]
MKILFVGLFLGSRKGGAEVSSKLLIENLAPQNQISVISLVENSIFSDDIEFWQIKSIFPKFMIMKGYRISYFSIKRKLNKLVNTINPDIIYVIDLSLLIPGVEIANKNKIPVITTIRDYRFFCNLPTCQFEGELDFECFKSKYSICNRKLRTDYNFSRLRLIYLHSHKSFPLRLMESINNCSHVFAVSNYVKNSLISLNVKSEPIVTYYPSEFESIKSNLEPSSPTSDPFIIFSYSNFNFEKGMFILVKAFHTLVYDSKINNINLIIAGYGPEFNIIKDYIDVHKIPNVKLLGRVGKDEIYEILNNCKVVVSPSIWPEPLSRLLIDSLYLGKTIIASNVGGSTELIQKGVCISFQNNNINSLAFQIKRVFLHPKIMDDIGILARKYYKLNHSETLLVKMHNETFLNLNGSTKVD